MKVSDAYSGSYRSVKQWPVMPEEHTITGAGIEDDNFAKANNARTIFLQFDKEEIK